MTWKELSNGFEHTFSMNFDLESENGNGNFVQLHLPLGDDAFYYTFEKTNDYTKLNSSSVNTEGTIKITKVQVNVGFNDNAVSLKINIVGAGGKSWSEPVDGETYIWEPTSDNIPSSNSNTSYMLEIGMGGFTSSTPRYLTGTATVTYEIVSE